MEYENDKLDRAIEELEEKLRKAGTEINKYKTGIVDENYLVSVIVDGGVEENYLFSTENLARNFIRKKKKKLNKNGIVKIEYFGAVDVQGLIEIE